MRIDFPEMIPPRNYQLETLCDINANLEAQVKIAQEEKEQLEIARLAGQQRNEEERAEQHKQNRINFWMLFTTLLVTIILGLLPYFVNPQKRESPPSQSNILEKYENTPTSEPEKEQPVIEIWLPEAKLNWLLKIFFNRLLLPR